jgi:hypothetical protein
MKTAKLVINISTKGMTLSNETTKARVDFFTKNYDGKERLLDELDEMIDEIIEGRTSLED